MRNDCFLAKSNRYTERVTAALPVVALSHFYRVRARSRPILLSTHYLRLFTAIYFVFFTSVAGAVALQSDLAGLLIKRKQLELQFKPRNNVRLGPSVQSWTMDFRDNEPIWKTQSLSLQCYWYVFENSFVTPLLGAGFTQMAWEVENQWGQRGEGMEFGFKVLAAGRLTLGALYTEIKAEKNFINNPTFSHDEIS